MRIYEYKNGIECTLVGERVVALGFFDGVHAGHRELIRVAKRRAEALNLPLAVFTFSAESKGLKFGTARLYSDEQKLTLLSECGTDEVIIADFDELHLMSAEDFVNELLISRFGARSAVSGRDFRFGHKAIGTQQMLASLMKDSGREAIAVDDVIIDGKKASTTEIKKLLSDGNIECAEKMLEKPYFITATIERGHGVGHALGYPTANCPLGTAREILKKGVYRTKTEIDGKAYPSLTNVGSCPTFRERDAHAETYIFDFDGDIYNKSVNIYFYEFLREEIKFSDEKELKMQINIDINKAKGAF